VYTLLAGQLDKIETNELRLVTYNYGHKYILPHAGRCFHSALDFHKELFDYTPSEKISLLIQDFGDYGNAGATAVPKNAISMGLSPFSYAFETSPAGEKVFSMMNHELVHVVALDNASRSDRVFRKLFLGKVSPSPYDPISMVYSYLTNPRRYSPRWYHEGIAAYLETWMSGGLGLALGSYDEMVFRTRVLEDAHIYSAQGLESEGVTTDFQGRTNSYLYGTRFMGYLSYTYGPDKIIEWVKRGNGSKAFFVSQFENVFGIKINKAWDDWIDFERDWQHKNIETLMSYPNTVMNPITENAVGSVAYAHYDKQRNKVYTAVNNPGKVPHLASLNLATGKLTPMTDIKGAALFYVTSLTYDPEGEVLYYTSDNDKWRDLNSYDIKTKETQMLQKDFRTGDLSFNKADKSIWGIKHLNGLSTIVRVPHLEKAEEENKTPEPYSSWEQIYTLPYGQDIFDIDVSPDGQLLSAAVSDLNGNQILIIYQIENLLNSSFEGDTLFNFEVASPQSFRFTDDGKYLFGSSYYTGVSNIFRVNVETKEIAAMSNSVTGLFRPTYIDEEKLFAFNFKSDGFQPVFIPNEQVNDVANISFLGNITVEKHPVLEKWALPIPRAEDINLDELIIKEEKYRAVKEMEVKFGYPVVVGYKNNIGLGYKINIGDPFNFRTFDFTIAYTPKAWKNQLLVTDDNAFFELEDEELLHVDFELKAGKFAVNGGYNSAEFHDLFGPSQGSRKGARLGISYDETLIYDPPKVLSYNFTLSGFYGLDQSPEYQTIKFLGYDPTFFTNLSGSLNYSSSKGSLGAVDAEKGLQASLWASTASSAGQFYPRVIGSANYGIQLPGKHFSLWLRGSGGSSFTTKFNPFTRFGFGAFGNNYIDYQSTRQYRSPFSFPGISYSEDRSVIAQRFGKAMAEFVIPPLRFKNLGGFNFFANWIQPTVFSSILYTSDERELEGQNYILNNKLVNVGGQIDLRMVTFSLLPSTLSVGYAKAWDLESSDSYGEWMISLKLLH
jgi:6-phosphogluconolactonase (cycloisomerase 2 family)